MINKKIVHLWPALEVENYNFFNQSFWLAEITFFQQFANPSGTWQNCRQIVTDNYRVNIAQLFFQVAN